MTRMKTAADTFARFVDDPRLRRSTTTKRLERRWRLAFTFRGITSTESSQASVESRRWRSAGGYCSSGPRIACSPATRLSSTSRSTPATPPTRRSPARSTEPTDRRRPSGGVVPRSSRSKRRATSTSIRREAFASRPYERSLAWSCSSAWSRTTSGSSARCSIEPTGFRTTSWTRPSRSRSRRNSMIGRTLRTELSRLVGQLGQWNAATAGRRVRLRDRGAGRRRMHARARLAECGPEVLGARQ